MRRQGGWAIGGYVTGVDPRTRVDLANIDHYRQRYVIRAAAPAGDEITMTVVHVAQEGFP
jgi:hypothetical protein